MIAEHIFRTCNQYKLLQINITFYIWNPFSKYAIFLLILYMYSLI